MPPLSPFVELSHATGKDTAEKFNNYIEELYQIYLQTVVHSNLTFKNLPVNTQRRPETLGKSFAFWHMMQEGNVEEERTPDFERCKRIRWIGWTIQNADKYDQIRVFPQQKRGREESWALWLYEQDYVVILHYRKTFLLLKTAFMVKKHKQQELLRDWNVYTTL